MRIKAKGEKCSIFSKKFKCQIHSSNLKCLAHSNNKGFCGEICPFNLPYVVPDFQECCLFDHTMK